MRATKLWACWLVVGAAACNGSDKGEPECVPEAKFEAFVDLDGDGFGTESAGMVCALGDDQAEEDGDCADDDRRVHPDAEERCNGADDDCDDALDDGLVGRVFYLDGDGDGYGDALDAVVACAAPPDRVEDDTDCDDTREDISPGSLEICSDRIEDEDCDTLIDDLDDTVDPASKTAFYLDTDEDGHGDPDRTRASCVGPVGSVEVGDDCDDRRADVNPGMPEVCNGRDDDCDGMRDHTDPSIDPALLLPGFADVDEDGFGDPLAAIFTCGYAPGIAIETGTDCDDANDAVNPDAFDRPCDSIDNDCDPATSDNPDRDGDGTNACDGDCSDIDPSRFPAAEETPADNIDSDCDGQEHCFHDDDDDGLRNDVAVASGADGQCTQAPNIRPTAGVDCDDADAGVNWSGEWVDDIDGDGVGAGPVTVSADCTPPGAGYAPIEAGEDCNDADDTQFPGAPDPCRDGLDSNCDGTDQCQTCDEILEADPASTDGVYALRPNGGASHQIYCDMTTDGGGWTLVAVSENVGAPMDDNPITASTSLDLRGGFVYSGGVWNGLEDVLGATSDMRFTCAVTQVDPSTVDLSFYDVGWYQSIVRTSCFVPANQPFTTPERRNNLTGDVRTSADPYAAGMMIGEDNCNAFDDFTVDFEDGGMNANESDGTDWGYDDFISKCGNANQGWGWYVYVR